MRRGAGVRKRETVPKPLWRQILMLFGMTALQAQWQKGNRRKDGKALRGKTGLRLGSATSFNMTLEKSYLLSVLCEQDPSPASLPANVL